LADYGGKFKLTDDWAKNVLKPISYLKWKACSKMNLKLTLNNLGEVERSFLQKIKYFYHPDGLILGFNKTTWHYIPVTLWKKKELRG